MSRLLRSLIVVVALALAVPAAAIAKNSLSVSIDHNFISQLRLVALYHVVPPKFCADPYVAPTPLCRDFAEQKAGFILQIRFGRRLIYEETGHARLGIWLWRVPFATLAPETRGCKPGPYRYTVIMPDPFARANWDEVRRGSFTIRC